MWATPEAEKLIVKMARVSNPSNEDNWETGPKLLKYLIKHQHWSPFEMATMCIQIDTQRDIAAQITRHRSFRSGIFNSLRQDCGGKCSVVPSAGRKEPAEQHQRHSPVYSAGAATQSAASSPRKLRPLRVHAAARGGQGNCSADTTPVYSDLDVYDWDAAELDSLHQYSCQP